MQALELPPWSDDWQPTLDTIHEYARVLGALRKALAPKQKHWWHTSLNVCATGLYTGTLTHGIHSFELGLDFTESHLVLRTSRGVRWYLPLMVESPWSLCRHTLGELGTLGVGVDLDCNAVETAEGAYQPGAAIAWWQALARVDATLKAFRAEQREETSPVQLWPHHFDLSMSWFTGRRVPGVDPGDEEKADEQLTFGFAPPDTGIQQPYFYVTAYPTPVGFSDIVLPAGARWETDRFLGAILPYATAAAAEDPAAAVLGFFRSVQQASRTLMRASVVPVSARGES